MYDTLKLGVVVASYPAGNSVDVLLSDDGSRFFNVQVMVPTGSSSTGVIDLPDIGLPLDESRWSFTAPAERYVRAVLAFMGGHPIVLGFLLPQVNQITFDEPNRRLMKHASDVYTSVDQFGNIEVAHPSGMFMRIGTTPGHENLTAKDVDKQFAIKKNTTAPVYFHLQMTNNTASIDIDPTGNIAITHNGNLTTTTAGNASIKVTGTTAVNSTGNVTVTTAGTATVSATGNVSVSSGASASVTATGGVTVNAGTTASVTASGGVTISAGGAVSITGSSVSLN